MLILKCNRDTSLLNATMLNRNNVNVQIYTQKKPLKALVLVQMCLDITTCIPVRLSVLSYESKLTELGLYEVCTGLNQLLLRYH